VTKIYYLKLLRASEGTLSCWSWLHLQSLAPTNPHWACVVDYGPFSLCVIHKEGLSSGDINRLMMMMMNGRVISVNKTKSITMAILYTILSVKLLYLCLLFTQKTQANIAIIISNNPTVSKHALLFLFNKLSQRSRFRERSEIPRWEIEIYMPIGNGMSLTVSLTKKLHILINK
jgi:hypothetical protein